MNTSLKHSLGAVSLFSAIILGGCVSQSDYDAVVQKNKDLQAQVTSQQSQIAMKDQQISRLQGAIAYTVNSDLLFPPGSWHMSAAGKRLIGEYAAKLAPAERAKIYISGFTDNTPIGPRLASEGVTSNEILSQKRAEDVMQYLISQGVKPELLEAKGFGEAHPVASNDTPEGRAKNRRVVLSLNPM